MQPQDALSFSELVLNASFLVQCVMFFLLVLSVVSWTIIVSRNTLYRQGRLRADTFEERFWSGIDLNNLYQDCMKRPEDLVGLEVIYSAGFKEFVRLVNSGPTDQDVVMDGTYRQMKVACSREVEILENHLPTLATIGSISPYIGLFGTVWGIMHAFVSLAAVKNATLSMVAPPIAEALIATAMGLFAAIPAVMFYNRFITKVEALENRYYNFMDEFSTILNRRLVTIRTQVQRQSGGVQVNMMNSSMSPVASMSTVASSMGSVGVPHPEAPAASHPTETSFGFDAENKPEEEAVPRPAPQNNSGRTFSSRFMKSVGRNDSKKAAFTQNNQRPATKAAPQAQGSANVLHLNSGAPQSLAAASERKAAPQDGQAHTNDMRFSPVFRGTVPPRAPLQKAPLTPAAQAPEENGPVYRTGPEISQRFNQNTRDLDDEPHYITPGARH